MTLPEPLSGSQKQYHSNPTIVPKGSVAKSKKFDMAIQPQELFAYKIRNAKVQYAHGDRETILTSTGCDLHLFADQISARPPVGFPLTQKMMDKRPMRISKGILLHWNSLSIENWILQSLPKLQFIIENDWFGEYESAVILPYSDVIKEYTEL